MTWYFDFGLAKYAHNTQVFLKGQNKEMWLALIGRSQWLTHVTQYHYIYIVQDFMCMGVGGEQNHTILDAINNWWCNKANISWHTYRGYALTNNEMKLYSNFKWLCKVFTIPSNHIFLTSKQNLAQMQKCNNSNMKWDFSGFQLPQVRRK
jgi:hypothetical protein